MKIIKTHSDLLENVTLLGHHPSNIPEELVCLMYNSKKPNFNVQRYELFSKKKLASDKLPPTTDAFVHHMKRVNYQSFNWVHAHEHYLKLPEMEKNRWKIDKGNMVPVYMSNPPAPDVVLTLTECKCKANCSTRR